MRIVETEREEFDEPVVELWRDDEFVGMVFWDDDTAIVQIYADDDGDVKDLDTRDLIRVLDIAEQIVSPVEHDEALAGLRAELQAGADEDDDEDEDEEWGDEHPSTVALVDEFDPLATHRSEDGEGFFSKTIASEFVERCDQLDLAVVEMEAFDLEGETLVPRPNLNLTIRVEDGTVDWDGFRAAANVRIADALADWPSRASLVISFVVQQPDGETFVA